MGQTLDELNASVKAPATPSAELVPFHKAGGSTLTCYGPGGKHFIFLMDPISREVTKHYYDEKGEIGPAVPPDWVTGNMHQPVC